MRYAFMENDTLVIVLTAVFFITPSALKSKNGTVTMNNKKLSRITGLMYLGFHSIVCAMCPITNIRQYCGSIHVYPDPKNFILIKMMPETKNTAIIRTEGSEYLFFDFEQIAQQR